MALLLRRSVEDHEPGQVLGNALLDDVEGAVALGHRREIGVGGADGSVDGGDLRVGGAGR